MDWDKDACLKKQDYRISLLPAVKKKLKMTFSTVTAEREIMKT